MARTVTTAEAQEQFSDLLSQVAHNKERIILSRRGKDIAALIPMEDLTRLQGLLDKDDLQEATEALKEVREQGTISITQLLDEFGG